MKDLLFMRKANDRDRNTVGLKQFVKPVTLSTYIYISHQLYQPASVI
jgi:hypothetical protein